MSASGSFCAHPPMRASAEQAMTMEMSLFILVVELIVRSECADVEWTGWAIGSAPGDLESSTGRDNGSIFIESFEWHQRIEVRRVVVSSVTRTEVDEPCGAVNECVDRPSRVSGH